MQTEDVILRIKEITGKNIPVSITCKPDGLVSKIQYEKSWKDGNTTPVKNKKGEVVDYKENYTTVTLNDNEVTELDNFIKSVTE